MKKIVCKYLGINPTNIKFVHIEDGDDLYAEWDELLKKSARCTTITVKLVSDHDEPAVSSWNGSSHIATGSVTTSIDINTGTVRYADVHPNAHGYEVSSLSGIENDVKDLEGEFGATISELFEV